MKSSDLIRWSGLAATIAGALFIVINLIALLNSSFGQGSLGLLVRNVVSPLGGTVLVLGLVDLYARQSEVAVLLACWVFSSPFSTRCWRSRTTLGPTCWPTLGGHCLGCLACKRGSIRRRPPCFSSSGR